MSENITVINFHGKDSVRIKPLYRWDTGQVFKFEDIPDLAEVQFEDGSVKIISNGQITVPNAVLEMPGEHKAWVQIVEADSSTTIKTIYFLVNYRTKSDDGVTPEDQPNFREQIQGVLNNALEALDEIAQSTGAAVDMTARNRISSLTAADVGINYPVGFGLYQNGGTNSSMPANFKQGISIGHTDGVDTYPLLHGNLITSKSVNSDSGTRGFQILTDYTNRIMTRTADTSGGWTNWAELAKNGDNVTFSNMTSNGTLSGIAAPGAPASNLYIVPLLNREAFGLGAGTTNDEFFRKWLISICAIYSAYAGLFIGAATSDVQGFVRAHIYDTTDKNAEGLPRYSSGTFQSLTGLWMFRTNEFNYTCKLVSSF